MWTFETQNLIFLGKTWSSKSQKRGMKKLKLSRKVNMEILELQNSKMLKLILDIFYKKNGNF